MPVLASPPYTTDLVDAARRISGRWLDWLIAPAPGNALNLTQALAATIYRPVDPVNLPDINAAIVATSFPTGTIAAGLYRVTWYLQVTVVDGAGSSFTVTIGFTSSGIALTASGAPVNGDTLSTFQTTGTGILQVDQGSPITYGVAYSSTTPNKAHAKLTLVLEQMN